MPKLDRNRLVKLLNLTTSNMDGEALGAVRLANAALRKAKLSWEQVIGGAEKAKTETSVEQEEEPLDFTFDPASKQERPTAVHPADVKDAARTRVRAYPLFVRLLFFPVWLTAEAYVTASIGERWPMKALTLSAPLLVAGLTGAAWVSVVMGIIRRMG